MKVNIKDLHPTQLYLSEKKLQGIQRLYKSAETINVVPISILAFGDCLLITDGHHRAYQALLAGRDTISAEWDRDGGDELWYNWCDGFNQATTLLLKRKADETDFTNR